MWHRRGYRSPSYRGWRERRYECARSAQGGGNPSWAGWSALNSNVDDPVLAAEYGLVDHVMCDQG